ncbi:MAG TPA: hypothetical protein VLV83_20465 [Acidobacteriota bacterium]|nr:hypothetical protein [Acidobacteriota bacterium]
MRWFGFMLLVLTGGPDELLERHIASLDDRPVELKGTVTATITTGGQAEIRGDAVWRAKAEGAELIFSFGHPEYLEDHVSFVDGQVRGQYARPGQHSELTSFLLDHEQVMKAGLFGGSLRPDWFLALRSKKVRPKGRKDGLQRYRCSVRNLTSVDVYLDDDGRHVRTVYRVRKPAGMGRTPVQSARLRDQVTTVTEFFHWEEQKLTQWRIVYERPSIRWEYVVEVETLRRDFQAP